MNANKIDLIVLKFESNNNPLSVSITDNGNYYGLYQLSSSSVTVKNFIEFIKNTKYYNELNQLKIDSNEFVNKWKELSNDQEFIDLQYDFIINSYYNPSKDNLKDEYYDMDKHSYAMKCVLLSRAIQYSPYYMVELYKEALKRFNYDNLSYVDDSYFDKDMIVYIYDFLIKECDDAKKDEHNIYHSPNDWCNGNYSLIQNLKNRFIKEKEFALSLL